jgi:hypothetical protein
VVKRALVIASQEEEYSRVLEDTHLLVCDVCSKRCFDAHCLDIFRSA